MILINGNFEYKVLSSFSNDIGNLIVVNLTLGEFTVKLLIYMDQMWTLQVSTPIFMTLYLPVSKIM